MSFSDLPSGSTSFRPPGSPQRPFISAQRRYDNIRIRENEIEQRVCFDCGRVVHGDDLAFQHHMVSHEAAFICYQLYHFEKGITFPKDFVGHSEAKHTKQRQTSPLKKKLSSYRARDTNRKERRSPSVKFNRSGEPAKKRGRKPKVRESAFINDNSSLLLTLNKQEPNLSDNGSDDTLLTDSDHNSEMSFKSEPDIELPVDDNEGDYVPRASTSTRGRPRKPKHML